MHSCKPKPPPGPGPYSRTDTIKHHKNIIKHHKTCTHNVLTPIATFNSCKLSNKYTQRNNRKKQIKIKTP